MPDAREPLPPQPADLVRRIARVFLDEPADLMDQVQAAVLAAADEPMRSEPTLAAALAASTRANVLHWAASLAAFALSADPEVLRQALAAGSRSLAGFVDDMVAVLSEQPRRERAELARGSHARRFEVASLILDSAPITTARAGTGLGYDLRGRHTAAVLWTDPRRPDQAALAAAEALGPAAGARQILTVIASSSSVWAWLAAADEQRAREFVAQTLGQLADAEGDLRDTLCAYIGEQFSAARATRSCTPTAARS